jgi:hypothetical protein
MTPRRHGSNSRRSMGHEEVRGQSSVRTYSQADMKAIVASIAVAFFFIAPASASDTSDAFARVKQFVDAWKGVTHQG